MPLSWTRGDPKREAAWERAKGRVREQYPKVREGSDRFYRLVMTIARNMTKMKREKTAGFAIRLRGIWIFIEHGEETLIAPRRRRLSVNEQPPRLRGNQPRHIVGLLRARPALDTLDGAQLHGQRQYLEHHRTHAG